MILMVLLMTVGLGAAQKGHYIRPLVETHHYPAAVTYGLPVYEEVPVVPRLYPGVFQTHPPPPHYRSRKTTRADDSQAGVRKSSTTSSAGAGSGGQPPLGRTSDEPESPVYPILSYRNEMSNEGDYSYKFETADGMRKEETSVTTMSEDGKTARSVRGSYSYPTADGRTIRVDYVADEGGFRATTVAEGEGAAAPGVGASYRRLGDRGFVYSYRAPT